MEEKVWFIPAVEEWEEINTKIFRVKELINFERDFSL